MIIRDTKEGNWTPVTDKQFNVSEALLFDSISIILKATMSEVKNPLTYKGMLNLSVSIL